MKTQVRLSVFETNSSSVHTLCISKKGIQKCRLKVADDGYIHVKLDQYYGTKEHNYTGQTDKLKYVCTWMFVYYGCDLENLYNGYDWRKFNKAFREYVNSNKVAYNSTRDCLGIVIEPALGYEKQYYLDHQSQPYGAYDDDNCVFDLYRHDDLINFIFNPNLWLNTDMS